MGDCGDEVTGIGHIKVKESWVMAELERLLDSIDIGDSKQRYDNLTALLLADKRNECASWRGVPVSLLRD